MTYMVRYFSEGETSSRLDFDEVYDNLKNSYGHIYGYTKDQVLQALIGNGMFTGLREHGHFVIIDETAWHKLDPVLNPLNSEELERHADHLLHDVTFMCDIVREVMEVFHQHAAFPDESLDIVADLSAVVDKVNAHVKGEG